MTTDILQHLLTSRRKTACQANLEKRADADVVAKLREAKAESDRGNYRGKARLVRELIFADPSTFTVDSRRGPTVGLTHRSGFRLHLPAHAVPDSLKAATDFTDAEDDTLGGPQAISKGWQWRFLNKEIEEGQQRWAPRFFTGPSTPASELLADPGRQGLLHALLGAGLGGLGGYLGGPHLSLEPAAGAAAGAGAGALLAGLLGYRSRQLTNDELIDRLRHLPPGATVAELEQNRGAP